MSKPYLAAASSTVAPSRENGAGEMTNVATLPADARMSAAMDRVRRRR
jgi:hypothetical protein